MMMPPPREPDDPRFTTVMLRRQLIAEGWNDRAIARMVAERHWVKPRLGAYVSAEAWQELDDVGRHEVTARAVLAQGKTDLVLSHASAGAVWELPFWGHAFNTVHGTRPDRRAGRKEAGVQQHRGVLLPEDVVDLHGMRVVSATRLGLEMTMVTDVEHAVSYLNYLLNTKFTSLGALWARYESSMDRWPRSLRTGLALRLAEPRCESVGESRTLHVCYRQSLPAPEPQYEVNDNDGKVVARLDFAWPELGVWLEFDGKTKYQKHLKEGESVTDAVLREKRREEMISELTGWRCIRITWADLYYPERIAARIRAMFRAPAVAV